MTELPSSWLNCRFGELVKVRNGFAFKSKEFLKTKGRDDEIPLVRQSQLRGSAVDLSNAVYLPAAYLEKYADYRIDKGDILIGMSGSIGKVCYYTNKSPALQNQRTGKLATVAGDALEGRFFGFCLLSVEKQLQELSKGMGVQNISAKDIENLTIPLPPLNEQRRIVEKIEAMFERIDKGVENLRTAKTTLALYRQSLLKSAFEGRLTADWRAKNADKLEDPKTLLARIRHERDARYKAALDDWQTAITEWRDGGEKGRKPAKPKRLSDVAFAAQEQTREFPELPFGWCYFTVGSLCEVVRGGSPRPAGDKRYYEGDIPFLKVADLTRPKGQFVRQFTYTIKEAGLSKTRLVEPETLMISNSGATLGVPKICKISATFNDGIAAFLGLNPDENTFHYWFWVRMTPVLRLINQGAAQPNLNTTLLAETLIPQCSPAEQAEITRILDARLDAADKMEAEIDASLTRADSLRQSILKQAFAGKLVPQNPTDEPATTLLARIKAERGQATKTARKGKITA